LNTGDLNDREVLTSEKKITELALSDHSTLKIYPPGSVVIAMYGATIGKVGLLRFPATVNQACCVFSQSTHFTAEFLFYWFLAARESIVSLAIGAGQPNISQEILRALRLPCPSLSEQKAIASFLNIETAKLDALMDEQQRLIDLLVEKRQAVISHAVTKGLDHKVIMKSSGVEWLGDVPAHWDYAALTRIASRVVVGIAEAATHAYADSGVPILRSTNIRAGKIIGEILYIDPEFAGGRDSKQIKAQDLITVRTGNAGVTAVIPPEFDGCQCFTMLITTLNKGSLPEYYCYWINSVSAQCYFQLEGWGTAQINISVPILKALPVPVPPTAEQEAIVAFLDYEVGKLDALSVQANHVIDLLHERRSALISAAVTGQIDVRKMYVEVAA
jgi:type I restriction enzyme S subunit